MQTTSEPQKNYWFPAKRYGWGWGVPRTWQGWLVFAGYFAVVIAAVVNSAGERNPTQVLVVVAVATAVMIAICWWKGEPPRWRWGGK